MAPKINSFYQMKKRPTILILGPKSASASWQEAIDLIKQGVTPWPHQQDMIDYLLGNVGALFSEVGTGKSLSCLVAARANTGEIEFYDLSYGPAAKRSKKYQQALIDRANDPTKVRVIYINHESAWRKHLADLIGKTDFSTIIVDEAHALKSAGSKLSQWASRFQKTHPNAKRIAATGTPCPDSPFCLYGIYRFLDSKILGTNFRKFQRILAPFEKQYMGQRSFEVQAKDKNGIRLWDSAGISWIQKIVSKNSICVRIDDCLDMPDEVFHNVRFELTAAEQKFYKQMKRDAVADLENDEQAFSANALAKTLKLKQAASGIVRMPDGTDRLIDVAGASKRKAFKEFVGSLQKENDLYGEEPIVVFYEYNAELAEIAETAKDEGRLFFQLNGHKNQMEEWKQAGKGILAVQIKAGGAGVNLQNARIAVFYSMTWSAGDYTQCKGRIRRPNQKATSVLYVHLIARDTIDEGVYRALKNKQRAVDAVVEGLKRDATIAAVS
jgi:SNF2 family DNA or RNA helicase